MTVVLNDFFGGGSKVFLSQDPQWNFNILQVCVSCKKYILKKKKNYISITTVQRKSHLRRQLQNYQYNIHAWQVVCFPIHSEKNMY